MEEATVENLGKKSAFHHMAKEPAELSEMFCCTSPTAKVGVGMDVVTDLSKLHSDKGDTTTDGGNIPP